MNTERTSIGWDFGLRWILLTVAGWVIGLPLGFVFVGVAGGIIGVPEGSDSIILKFGLDNATLFVFVVAVVSLMQWLALRRVVRRAGFWVLASIIGFAISSISHGVVCHVYGYPDDLGPLGAVGWAAAFVVGGAMTGLLQQRILQRQVRHSGWWVPASATGWGLSVIGFGLIALAFPKEAGPALIGGPVLPLGLGAILLGIVTGGALIWLLRQPMRAEELENANHTKF